MSSPAERGAAPADDLWIFGYGSLVWRPAFEHAAARPAWIAGHTRRFWQGSTDHRGVPGAPGRVVTLVPEAGARCFGMAYRVAAAAKRKVLEELDWREKGGYARRSVRLHPLEPLDPPAAPTRALVYVATPDNPNYLGPAPLERIAEQVRASHGPSGSNVEYVMRLAQALRSFRAEDAHVFALEALLAARG